MSYVKKNWAPRDKITSAALNNIENGVEANDTAAAAATPLRVPFTLEEDESITTTATFADVKAAVVAGRDATADIAMETDLLRLPLKGISPASDPTVLQFEGVVDLGEGASDAPMLFRIDFTASGVTNKSIALAVSSD